MMVRHTITNLLKKGHIWDKKLA